MKTINRSTRGELEGGGLVAVIILGVLVIFGVIALWMWGIPLYGVYSARKDGEAQLAHAQSSKEVAVAEAKAKMESAQLLAQAEIERAKGVAEANKIIGNSLKDNESYLRYLWISGLESNNPTVIYVPTEANLPILEAGKAPRK
jgi:regulator of protease activity HflC (stomatin/prohibitin superfamily)